MTENGEYILPGFSGSPVISLDIRVNDYQSLWNMIRSNYGGRLADVLNVELS